MITIRGAKIWHIGQWDLGLTARWRYRMSIFLYIWCFVWILCVIKFTFSCLDVTRIANIFPHSNSSVNIENFWFIIVANEIHRCLKLFPKFVRIAREQKLHPEKCQTFHYHEVFPEFTVLFPWSNIFAFVVLMSTFIMPQTNVLRNRSSFRGKVNNFSRRLMK